MIRISFSELHTEKGVPLESLTLNDHVHGRLEIEIDGETLPHLGFGGPEKVCIGPWYNVLTHALAHLSSRANACFYFDEGELPAVEFDKVGDTLYVSSLATKNTGPIEAPMWQRRPCEFAAFREAAERFLAEFREELQRRGPGARWCELTLGTAWGQRR
jgi:hypothetical protein